MESIGKRIFEVRKALNLSMDEFGGRLGVTRSAISKIETGVSNLTDQTQILLCKVYNVNPTWLHDGIGDMFMPDNDLDNLAAKYDLSDFGKRLLKGYILMPQPQREQFEMYLKNMLDGE